ncbi:arginine--tRNA ligase [Lentzea sp. NBC_00516]|uniref:arginine--tRNA ligase n=1 Tax=Lentzea sp. NBC_00516 TaxID=2903582 RepID=UPI002E809ADA|nr:arginine--tRNA ligase [Lentzea sp. NBC_00516]WUD24964.1 arginine--tRNA ligase [Lentzea sp. NBC_00516]
MLRGDVGLELGQRVARALRVALDVDITAEEALIRPSNRDGADYQCNVAMSLAKKIGKNPREVAALIVEHLDAQDAIETPEIAGPGFINLKLRREWLEAQAASLVGDSRLGVPETDEPRRIAIDYSSPNVAKEMHVGHLRSTIIGDAFCRLLTFAGHEVIPHNHLGDWGTPFGMLIEHLTDEGQGAEHEISDLNAFYQQARQKFDSDPGFADRARRRVVLLQGGDEATLKLWHELVGESQRHFNQIYELLGIGLSAGDNYGESFYNPYLADTITELQQKGLIETSDGALCVFPPGFSNREGDRLPLIVRKSDGGYGYATTDFATVRYWVRDRKVDELIYVVGTPQSQHFQMIFATSKQAGWLDDAHTAVHTGFGTILGADGKTIRTRAGGTIKLIDLLTEAVENAYKVMPETSDVEGADKDALARTIGLGAVKYADLSNDREKDYVFTWEKMLAHTGDTSVYIQYAIARINAIGRMVGRVPADDAPLILQEQAERDLALKLLQLPTAIQAAIDELAPHKLTNYLFETATAFTAFYSSASVSKAETQELQDSRLQLLALTSRVLTLGLSLLGIGAPERL